MKKFLRILIIAISSAIVLYGLFVGVECVRLYNAHESKPPIISTQPTEIQRNDIKYTGLGYTITYEIKEDIKTEENGSLNTVYEICGAEFRLFDKILLWAWIADTDMNFEKFSYEEECREYDGVETGVKRSNFHNTKKFQINNQSQAIELAKNEVTVGFDNVSVAFDEEAEMWKVHFYIEGNFGGDQTVYLDKDGITQLCVCGE